MRSFIIIFSLFFSLSNAFANEHVKVTSPMPELVQKGNFALVMPGSAKIIEVNQNGDIVWDFKIPSKYLNNNAPLSRGPDIKWIKSTDTFLVTLPKVGIIEVSKAKNVIWEYMTQDISHDADLLSDNTIIFVNGWDKPDDKIITRINRNGDILSSYTAANLSISIEDQKLNIEGNTHINSITVFNESDFMISLRNYHSIRRYKQNQLTWEINNASRVHDPIIVDDHLYFAERRRGSAQGEISQTIQKHNLITNSRKTHFRAPDIGWTPLRTLELLENGNFLITGSTKVGQLSPAGDLVWQIEFLNFSNQNSQQRNVDFIYKAAFVYK